MRIQNLADNCQPETLAKSALNGGVHTNLMGRRQPFEETPVAGSYPNLIVYQTQTGIFRRYYGIYKRQIGYKVIVSLPVIIHTWV